MNRDTTNPNPLLQDWTGPYGLPPFATLLPGDFLPAFDVALPAHLVEIDAIANNPAPVSFANTLQALDESGRLRSRIDLLFHNLTASETSPELQAVEDGRLARVVEAEDEDPDLAIGRDHPKDSAEAREEGAHDDFFLMDPDFKKFALFLLGFCLGRGGNKYVKSLYIKILL